MPRSRLGRQRPARDRADGVARRQQDRAAGARDGALPPCAAPRGAARGPLGLGAPQHVGAGEVLVERADPAEARLDRVRLLRDVVAVQRVADLEPQRVARAEPAGHDAGSRLRAGRPTAARCRPPAQISSTPGLARVAGARDGQRTPATRASMNVEVGEAVERRRCRGRTAAASSAERGRALQRDHAVRRPSGRRASHVAPGRCASGGRSPTSTLPALTTSR